MAMDYNSLKAQMLSWAKRTDQAFIDQLPNFITQGVNRIYSEAKNIGLERMFTTDLQPGTAVLAKANGWKSTVSIILTVNGATPTTYTLLPRSLEFCKTYWPQPSLQGRPLFYADYSNTAYYFAPTPDFAYQIQVIDTRLPPALNPAQNTFFANALGNEQNFFLADKYPQLVFYACMLEAEPFLKSDERIPVFESLYNRALADINSDAKKIYTDRSSKRDVE
jgi:hypothetical protein